MSRTEVLFDTGTMRALPDLPRRMASTPVTRSTSQLSRASASLIRRPVTAMRPKSIAYVSARMPLAEGSRAAPSIIYSDLPIAIDIWTGAAMSAQKEGFRRYFVSRIDSAQPLGKLTNDHQSPCPGLRTRLTECVLPPQEEVGGDVINALAVGEGNKSPQYPCRCTEVKSQTAADRQIAVKLVGQGAHFPPVTGHS